MRYILVAVILSLLSIVITACSGGPAGPAIEVSDPWVRAPAAMPGMSMDTPGALYMVIRNHGDAADRLLEIECDIAGLAQVHLTEVDANGVASMHEVEALEIPAGGAVEFKPGGYHVMLMDMKRELTAGESIKCGLIFGKAGRLDIEAPVKAP